MRLFRWEQARYEENGTKGGLGMCDLSVALAPREMVFSVEVVENHRHHHAEPLYANRCNKGV